MQIANQRLEENQLEVYLKKTETKGVAEPENHKLNYKQTRWRKSDK